MDTSVHTFSAPFKPLGLPSDMDAIDAFIDSHSPISVVMPLAAAPFWISRQAAFIREALSADSDWTEIVNQRNACLRA